jgi:PAS domain S-box-containing protein
MTTASKSSGGISAEAARALQIVESMSGHAWSADAAGSFTYVSERTLAYYGRTGSDWRQVVHPDDYNRVAARWQHCLQTGEDFDIEHRLRRSDGVYRWFRNSGRPSRDDQGRITEWYGTALDIEDQKQAEAALLERELELSQLFDMVPGHLWRLAPDGEPIFFNMRMVDFLGLDVADTDKPGMSRLAVMIEAAIHPDDAATFGDALNRCLVTGEGFVMRYRLRRADGVYRWMSSCAEPVRDQHGLVIQWYGLCHDIDDQVRAEEALRQRERELLLLVDMVPSYLWRLTPEGETTLVNKRLAEFLGVDAEDKRQLEDALATTIHPDDEGEVGDVLGRCLLTGERFSKKYRLRHADGSYRWMLGCAEPLRDQDGRIVQWFGFCHDIDDQIHAEEALRRASDRLAQATRAASLAELSASIAHEVNQPLAAIVANSYACHRWLSAEPPNIERAKITAERIIRDANSAADVVSRIRALFRQAPQARPSEDVNRVISEVCQLMGDEVAAKHIRIEADLEPSLPVVALDRVQVQQVFVNLIRNGIESMDAALDGDRALQIRSRRDGFDAVRVEVRDAGTGFKDANRAFEPFFTTKQHGMGMGLAICRSIIESHGGRLWMANNETRGATVAFTLPLAAGQAP